jgi:hypothetical protein
MSSPQLVSALGWSESRLYDAISRLRRHPTLGDPFILAETDAGYSLEPRSNRLSAEQRAALKSATKDTAKDTAKTRPAVNDLLAGGG